MTDKTISPQTEETVLELRGKFGPTGIVGTLLGRGKKSNNKEVTFTGTAKSVGEDNKTATKIKPLEEGNMMVEALLQIYDFLKASSEERKLQRELLNNMIEPNKADADKRHKELLDALKALKVGKGKGKTSEPITEDGGLNIGVDLPTGSAKSILQKVGSLLVGGGVFTAAAVAAAFGLPVMYLMNRQTEEEAQETTKSILAAPGGTSEVVSTYEAIKNTDAREKKRMNILADRPWSKKSLAFWKDPEEQKKYLEEIGWDDNTGTTKAERDAGFIAIDENGKLIKSPTASQSSIQESPSNQNIPTPSEPPAIDAGNAKLGERLNNVVTENNTLKLPSNSGDEAITTINNLISPTNKQTSDTYDRDIIPPVRNLEETFQKMIYYSTRVV